MFEPSNECSSDDGSITQHPPHTHTHTHLHPLGFAHLAPRLPKACSFESGQFELFLWISEDSFCGTNLQLKSCANFQKISFDVSVKPSSKRVNRDFDPEVRGQTRVSAAPNPGHCSAWESVF